MSLDPLACACIAHPSGESLRPIWVGHHYKFSLVVPHYDQNNFLSSVAHYHRVFSAPKDDKMAPEHAAGWMQHHLPVVGDLPVSQLCMPASHDAGTYRLGYHTSFGTESNVLTQTCSISDQLELGVRYFDIRPALTSPEPGQGPGRWAAGHYTGEAEGKIGWQGGNGVEIEEVIGQINNFTRERAELVIVEISHIYRVFIDNPISSTARGPDNAEQHNLLDLLGKLERRFTVEDGVKDKPIHEYTLRQFVGKGHAAVVVLIDDIGDHAEIYKRGFWPFRMSNGAEYFNPPKTSITRTQDTGDAVLSTFGSLLSTVGSFLHVGSNSNGSSVLSLAEQEQEKRFPWVLSEYAAGSYPGFIALDRIQNLDLLTLCLAVAFQRRNISLSRTDLIVVYGGALITDANVCNAIRRAINEGRSFQVTNDTMGGDPWVGVAKSCAVYYRDRDLFKARFARENNALHFEMDILEIVYGGKVVADQQVYLRFLRAIADREPLKVTNENLGGDPAFGVVKSCRVKFRDMNDTKEREKDATEGDVLDF